MKKLLVATRNSGKFHEIIEALSDLPLGLVSLGEHERLGGVQFGDPVEDGATFRENAYKKARYFFEKIRDNLPESGEVEEGLSWVLAEDSGILVDALVGELGMKTRRWGAGEMVTDQRWIDYFMKRMDGVVERGERFVCEACLIGNFGGKGVVKYFKGETLGVITKTLEAPLKPGIPLSSCFRPEGFDCVYAALSVEEKNRISHRGKAMLGVGKFFVTKPCFSEAP